MKNIIFFIVLCLVIYWLYLYKKINVEHFDNISDRLDETDIPYNIWHQCW